MSTIIRILLIIGSVLFFLFLLNNIRNSKFSKDMAVLWISLSIIILIMAIIPEPFINLMKLVGIESAVNGVLIVFILLLLLLVFYLYKKISILESKLINLSQIIGIREHKHK